MVREDLKRERRSERARRKDVCGPIRGNLMPFFVYYHFHVRSVNLFKFELPPLSLLPTARSVVSPSARFYYQLQIILSSI